MRKIELYEITPEELVEMIINGLKDSNFNGVEKGTFLSSQILDITGAMKFSGMTR